MAHEDELPQIPRPKARHRMRWSLAWPAPGARRAGRDPSPEFPGGWSRKRAWLVGALVLSLAIAAVGIAALPSRWGAADAKTTPTPTGGRVVEATVGPIKRVLVLQGLVVRQPDEQVRTPATGTITSITAQPGDEVAAGDTLAVITLPLPEPSPTPELPSPSPTVSPSASPTTSPSPSPLPPPPPQAEVRSVTAPIDGTVKDLIVVLGQFVKTGKLVLTVEPKRFDVIAPVSPRLLYQFFEPPIALTGTIERGPEPFDCSFTSIGDNLEVTGAQSLLTQDADLRCAVPVATDVFPGVRVRLEATTAEVDDGVLVPKGAIQTDGDRRVVWVVEKGHPAVRRTVELGLSDDRNVQIVSGLRAGERVLVPSG